MDRFNATGSGHAVRPISHEVILSFDVEEHHRIEAAVGLTIPAGQQATYVQRVEPATRWLLERLAEHGLSATFFVVGLLARQQPRLVRAIVEAGHEVASHGWNHQRIDRYSWRQFREDLRRSRDTLQQITSQAVLGYRAPTFSLNARSAWAVDQLVEAGFRYDSSIYPIHHDRYGLPDAPRTPFLVDGPRASILELPPATVQLAGLTLPVGGGGYFRLLPGALTLWALQHARRQGLPVTTLYFHPWEFDPDQPRLPLAARQRWRTYVGLRRTRGRLRRLLDGLVARRAIDVATGLLADRTELPRFALAHPEAGSCSGDDPGAPTPAAEGPGRSAPLARREPAC